MNDKTAIEKAREALVEIANQEVGTWDKPVPFSVLYRRSVDIAREALAALDAEKPGELCHCTRSGGIDEDIMPIVDALNSAGIKTIASCCGHTFQPSSVILEHNGITKELRLFTFEQARKVDKLFPDINGDADKPVEDAHDHVAAIVSFVDENIRSLTRDRASELYDLIESKLQSFAASYHAEQCKACNDFCARAKEHCEDRESPIV